MKSRKFNFIIILENAKQGLYTKAQIKQFMKAADEFNMPSVVRDLSLYLVPINSFSGDSAPQDIKERVAKGMGYLNSQGHSLARTKQMLKRHGIIESINRVGAQNGVSKNLEVLAHAGLLHYAAESIVLDYPQLFSERVVNIAKSKLQKVSDPTSQKVKSILHGLVQECELGFVEC